MKRPELLSPVGDFECLKAAIQNGANAIYLGAASFSARAKATNFAGEELFEAIKYAKLRNVAVHLALNTLIKNEEFKNEDIACSFQKKVIEILTDKMIYTLNSKIFARVMVQADKLHYINCKHPEEIPRENWGKVIFLGVPTLINKVKKYALSLENTGVSYYD